MELYSMSYSTLFGKTEFLEDDSLQNTFYFNASSGCLIRMIHRSYDFITHTFTLINQLFAQFM